jgi:CMP-N-acetylneuraminic acid synthetase
LILSCTAFIPVRGGSKSIPLKNIKLIAGKPLIWWSLRACQQSKFIDHIIVATDSEEIIKKVKSFKFSKVEIYIRSKESATDTASTEFVMLEYLNKTNFNPKDLFILVQATNPFISSNDLDQAIETFSKQKRCKSLLSVVRTKRFFWDKNKPLNYNPIKRPRRQDYPGLLMENGAFYIANGKNILKSKNRLTKPIMTFEMPEHTGFEIDEPDDWIICEHLIIKHNKK